MNIEIEFTIIKDRYFQISSKYQRNDKYQLYEVQIINNYNKQRSIKRITDNCLFIFRYNQSQDQFFNARYNNSKIVFPKSEPQFTNQYNFNHNISIKITLNDLLLKDSCKISLFSSIVRYINTTKINKMRFNLNRRIRHMIKHTLTLISHFLINVKKRITQTKKNMIKKTRQTILMIIKIRKMFSMHKNKRK